MKNKIAFMINSLAGGGAERVVSTLLNELVDEYECYVILFENKIDYDLDHRVKVITIGHNYRAGLVNFLTLPFLAKSLASTVLKYKLPTVVSFLHRANYVNCLSSILSPHRIIISERIAASSLYQGKSLSSRISHYLIKKLYPKADVIISVSHAIKEELTIKYGIGNKHIVIYNPYHLSRIESLSLESVDIDMRNTIVTIGSLSKRKDHAGLLNALSLIENKALRLVLVGVGDQEQQLKKLATKLNIESRVIFAGFDRNPYKYLSKCSIFVSNSQSEGFPNVIAEALACGCPVVSTDCLSGPREILAPNTNYNVQLRSEMELALYGIIVPINSPVILAQAIDMMCVEQVNEQYRIKSKSRAADFNLVHITSQYIDIIMSDNN